MTHTGPRTRVTFMQMAFVLYIQVFGIELLLQGFPYS
jgi:hypothetical protein